MNKDPIVEEVRRIRREIERECEDKPGGLLRFYQDAQKKYADRLVRRNPVPLEPQKPR